MARFRSLTKPAPPAPLRKLAPVYRLLDARGNTHPFALETRYLDEGKARAEARSLAELGHRVWVDGPERRYEYTVDEYVVDPIAGVDDGTDSAV